MPDRSVTATLDPALALASTPASNAARLLAFYLPQFHPTPENDDWWGKGFTEWTNVAKAQRLFPGHYQPRVPRDLGFYDLRVPETRQAQADLAVQHGIEGFCYWHYWFAGRRILERPFHEVLQSGAPSLPFCLAWANDSWTGVWHGAKNRLLIEQSYPGPEDHTAHFHYLLTAFRDERYVRVDGKPLFAVLFPHKLPEAKKVTTLWRELARKAGLPGLHLVALVDHGELPYQASTLGFDAVCVGNQLQIHSLVRNRGYRNQLQRVAPRRHADLLAEVRWELEEREIRARYQLQSRLAQLRGRPRFVYAYRDAMRYFLSDSDYGVPRYPTLVPDWDHSPRCGGRGVILDGSTPDLFRVHVRETLDTVRPLPVEQRVVFIKSWNEWAEGNYMEPDLRWGDAYLKVVKDEVALLGRSPVRSASR